MPGGPGAPPPDPEPETEPGVEEIHGTAVAVDGAGLLMVGPSGSGKSALAVEMMALGAGLVADDRVEVRPGSPPVLAAPARWPGLVEVRGLGLLRVAGSGPVPCHAVLDLGAKARGRLPEQGTAPLGGTEVTWLRWGEGRPFAAALMLYLRCNCERG